MLIVQLRIDLLREKGLLSEVLVNEGTGERMDKCNDCGIPTSEEGLKLQIDWYRYTGMVTSTTMTEERRIRQTLRFGDGRSGWCGVLAQGRFICRYRAMRECPACLAR